MIQRMLGEMYTTRDEAKRKMELRRLPQHVFDSFHASGDELARQRMRCTTRLIAAMLNANQYFNATGQGRDVLERTVDEYMAQGENGGHEDVEYMAHREDEEGEEGDGSDSDSLPDLEEL